MAKVSIFFKINVYLHTHENQKNYFCLIFKPNMSIQTLSYKDTGYFSKLICDYLEENEQLKPFYNHFPTLEAFQAQMDEKQKKIPLQTRLLLAKRILYQYGAHTLSQSTLANIDLLKEENTFTVTTGHQLNLFTGPLYFLYKIFSVINLTERLKKAYPNHHFVPIFWMATEDHDFEEINHFYFRNNKITWNSEASGAVGELSTAGLEAFSRCLQKEFGQSENGQKLSKLFHEAYVTHKTLDQATRYIANQLFRTYGLVIVDGNDKELKACFAPYVKEELENRLSFHAITETTKRLTEKGYPEQVHPREINLFYLNKNIRERIVYQENRYHVLNTSIAFTKDEILDELQNYPERFSPNALLRPLYQEVILPNLCYIGGGGELAYWFQLKDYFHQVDVPFPILVLRNSVLLIQQKWIDKLNKLNVAVDKLFLSKEQLTTDLTYELSPIPIDFSTQKEHLQNQFQQLYAIAEITDASFLGAVAAQEKKQLNGLNKLEKRLLRAQKRKFSDTINRILSIQDELFPQQSLQERHHNFSEFYIENGTQLMDILKAELDPLDFNFKIITL